MTDVTNILSLAPAKVRDTAEKKHIGYDIVFIDGTVLTTNIINFEVFPGVSLLFLFSDDEDQHIESAYSMSTIKTIEARYEQ